uniref:Uncharacterized protein n=1 Tax=Oryza brachyantha TaxID=4533 RepID=J3LG65_ORYBR
MVIVNATTYCRRLLEVLAIRICEIETVVVGTILLQQSSIDDAVLFLVLILDDDLNAKATFAPSTFFVPDN